MTPIISFLLRSAFETMRSPRQGARRVMAIRMERRQRWEVLFLIATLSAILAYVSVFVSGAIATGQSEFPVRMNPLTLGMSQLVVMLVMVFAIHLVGSWVGGTGGLDDTILLVAWMQFILICLQVAQILALVIFPFLAVLLGVAGLVLVMVLLTVFVSELHGFKSVAGVFFSVLFVMLILATLIRFVFSLFGLDVAGMI